MYDEYGLFFNILQLIALYLYHLGSKTQKKHYYTWTGLIYLISVFLGIVHYTIITLVLFVVQILVIMVCSAKRK